jgi:hypothetical protein
VCFPLKEIIVTHFLPFSSGLNYCSFSNQIVEDMLIMYVMDRPNKWEEYLHLVVHI